MPTTRTLLRHFAKPLLARNPDLVLKGIRLHMKPVRHVARFILIDRSGPGYRNISWGVDDLFGNYAPFGLGYGGDIHKPSLWYLDDPSAPEFFVAEAESTALPALRSLETLESFYAFVTTEYEWNAWPKHLSKFASLRHHPQSQAPVLAAMGRFDEAKEICRTLPQHRWFNDPDIGHNYRRTHDELYPLLIDNDKPALARLLRSWQERRIQANKLEDIWEPTPFPFETCPPRPGRP